MELLTRTSSRLLVELRLLSSTRSQRAVEHESTRSAYERLCDQIAACEQQLTTQLADQQLRCVGGWSNTPRPPADIERDIGADTVHPAGQSKLEVLLGTVRGYLQTGLYERIRHIYAAETTRATEHLNRLLMIQRVLLSADSILLNNIKYTLQLREATDQNPENRLFQLVGSQSLLDTAGSENNPHPEAAHALVPHPALLRWVIAQPTTNRAMLPLIAWVLGITTDALSIHPEDDLAALLDLCLGEADQMEYTGSALTPDTHALDLAPFYADVPKAPGVPVKRTIALPYTLHHCYYPNTFKHQKGLFNEDYLLMLSGENSTDFCVVVADGASQASMSHIAAQTVAQYLFRCWMATDEHTSFRSLEQTVRANIYAAKYAATAAETTAFEQRIADETLTSSSKDIMTRRHQAGSQAIFAAVFRRGAVLTCVWMGNTKIVLQGDVSGTVIAADDPRFADDTSRFNTRADFGTHGTLHIQQFGPEADGNAFLTTNTFWRAIVHTDAFDVYEEPDHLYNAPLVARKRSLPLDIDGVMLNKCIDYDDTTLIEIFYDGTKNNLPS